MDVLAASLTAGLADLPSGVRAEDDEVEAEAGQQGSTGYLWQEVKGAGMLIRIWTIAEAQHDTDLGRWPLWPPSRLGDVQRSCFCCSLHLAISGSHVLHVYFQLDGRRSYRRCRLSLPLSHLLLLMRPSDRESLPCTSCDELPVVTGAGHASKWRFGSAGCTCIVVLLRHCASLCIIVQAPPLPLPYARAITCRSHLCRHIRAGLGHGPAAFGGDSGGSGAFLPTRGSSDSLLSFQLSPFQGVDTCCLPRWRTGRSGVRGGFAGAPV